MRPRPGSDPIVFTTNMVIRNLARRVKLLNAEMRTIDQTLTELISETAPSLLDLHGIGTDTAASLLVAAGDNPDRLHSERSWAHLCGVTPIPASSGKVTRNRLNRGGDRQANAALYRIIQNLRDQKKSRRPLNTRDHAMPQTVCGPPNLQTSDGLTSWVRSDPTNRLTHQQMLSS